MEVYHIGTKKFASQLTGEGAKLHGGRWNSIGTACLYTAESISLCVLEYAANVSLQLIPASLSITVYTLPEKSWKEFLPDELPKNWQEIPAPVETQEWGSAKLHEANFLALKLPSVIIPSEHNYILNPLHPEFKKVRIKEILPFTFDSRIKT
ncbi:MAG: RES domain-containing protein [Chitinophagaceae bacterium]|nr:MAG: RES domain-containing protein [Chitinophagaceae bacterium]